uniref:C962R-like N-terminal AEP domain-containing protein n=1 Tax=viral metagenome TaxID=1070528 RepID=A0A6C0J4N9_9ZZZZ
MSTELLQFLKQHESTGTKDANGKSIFTHSSIIKQCAYNIPDDKRKELHNLIATSICDKKKMFLMEKPFYVSCIKVEIDLRYSMNYSNRQHNDNHIKELLKLYATAISSCLDLPKDYPIDAYVLQRNKPYPNKGSMKDGIHILYPNICCHVNIQQTIRTKVLNHIDMFLRNPTIGILNTKNKDNDVIDQYSIDRNCWLTYGSMKPGYTPYLLYKVLRLHVNNDFIEIDTPSEGHKDIEDLLNLLSVRRVFKEITFNAINVI